VKRILLITNAGGLPTQIQALKDFTGVMNAASGRHEFHFCTVQELLFAVTEQGISIRLEGKELHEVCAVIHLRNVNHFPDFANAIRLYAERYGLELVNVADATLPYYGKVSQAFLMALNGIRTPFLYSSPSNETLSAALETQPFAYPVVIKHNDGIKGQDNFLARDADEAKAILKQSKQGFVLQPFIANSGELRVLRFGKRVDPVVFKKQAKAGSYLNNTSQGGSAALLPVREVEPRTLEQAMRAAELMGRDIAGIDVLLGSDGTEYVLEVNTTPSIATGAFMAEKQAQYDAFFDEGEGRA
jgi:glutathione synthase/RimK-type ligase-like ATP-grasp enzyme